MPFRYFLRHSNLQAAHHNSLSYIIKALLLYRVVTTLIAVIPQSLNNLLIGAKAEVLTYYLRDIQHAFEHEHAECKLQERICNSIN